MQIPRYSFGHEGQIHLLTPAFEAQRDIIEPFFENGDWHYDHNYFEVIPALYRRKGPTAFAGSDIVLVVMGFLGSCFAKKIFDEVYERILKHPIGEQLDKLFKKVEVPAGKVVEYRDIIYFEDIELAVVIRAIATKEATSELQSQVMQAHRVAHSYIEQYGRQAPIHCHKILDGQIAVEPELFRTLESIAQHDRAQLKVTVRK